MRIYELRGPLGRRAVGVMGSRVEVSNVEEFLEKLGKIDKENRTVSQVFNASYIAGVEHLVHSARSTMIAHTTRRNFASSLNIELLCWMAAEKQIARAFEKVGLREGGGTVAILTIGTSHSRVKKVLMDICGELGITHDNNVLELTREKISNLVKIFSISEEELKMVPVQKLVLERVALLALER